MHTVERAAIFSDADVIEASDFGIVDLEPSETSSPTAPATTGGISAPPVAAGPREPMSVSSAVEQVEEQLIRQAMVKFNGNKKRVAAELGISRSYLYKRLAQIGLGVESET
jgi:DNA-binding NtrC family response regulator